LFLLAAICHAHMPSSSVLPMSRALCVSVQSECEFVKSFGVTILEEPGKPLEQGKTTMACFQNDVELKLYHQACQHLVNMREFTRQLQGDVAIAQELLKLRALGADARGEPIPTGDNSAPPMATTTPTPVNNPHSHDH
jgi:hypothetical protein